MSILARHPFQTSHPCQANHPCQVSMVKALTAKTYQFELTAPLTSKFEYYAGQHLALELDVNQDGELHQLHYSIASPCDQARFNSLELLIDNSSEFAGRIIQRLIDAKNCATEINVTLAMGEAYLQTDLNLPHVLIAAGSGISKVKCIAHEILRQQPEAKVDLYWSNKELADFYLLDEFQALAQQHQNLTFTPILDGARLDDARLDSAILDRAREKANQGFRTGMIYQVIEQDLINQHLSGLTDSQVYLCGSPQMVYGTVDKLEPKGLELENCYSDVFAYAPRN